LTEAVRRRPYQIVLFDEVEKAHPDVFNVLLQMLDEGRLTDGQGRTVDFKNTVIILTSNLGSQNIASLKAGESIDKAKDAVMDAVRSHFKPEFINRLDEIVLFNRLQKENMKSIVDIQILRLNKLLADKNIKLELDEKALLYLAEKGFDEVYGARPMRRVIQNEIQNVLSEKFLEGKIAEGDEVKVSASKGVLIFEL